MGGWTHDGREMMLEKSVCPVCRCGGHKRYAVSGCGVAVQGSGPFLGYERGAQFLAVLMDITNSGRGGLLFVPSGHLEGRR